MDYYNRIQLALNYIEQHLHDALNIRDIAAQAHFSPFHFQRLFLAISGFSVHEYIRKRRLTEAADQLRHSNDSVLQVSLAFQYQSQEAFTRAFQSYTGLTPGKFRHSITDFTGQSRMDFLDFRSQSKGALRMNLPVMVQLNRTAIIGWEYPTNLNQDTHYQEIPGFYDDFGRNGRFLHIDGKTAPGMSYGIACRFQENGDFSFIIGEQVDENATPGEGYVRFEIPEGNYAEFKAFGGTELVQQTRDYIYGTWLPESNYERREGPDFEITDVLRSTFPNDQRVKIYIPVD
ncbi:AraC family transcriptional regulator [Paenibacillus albidus]|uniref:AraC family transcriptional regulator n=1 Tax=Paenibacillus albidus TaxID=2041023 RepID=UPI001BE7572A|nr:AraC family transcriptional regulator [Paenibacillus albidus]MBT2292090.1 AraC family transcriptional regulator [Paenibacillus albidus]